MEALDDIVYEVLDRPIKVTREAVERALDRFQASHQGVRGYDGKPGPAGWIDLAWGVGAPLQEIPPCADDASPGFLVQDLRAVDIPYILGDQVVHGVDEVVSLFFELFEEIFIVE